MKPSSEQLFEPGEDLLVVVLHYRQPESTRRLVEGLLSQGWPADHVLVVDNASPEGSGARLREQLPAVLHQASRENLGFSGGMNLGLARAREGGFAAAALLNNDLRIDRADLLAMRRTLDRDPRIGMVGAAIHRSSREDPPVHAGETLHPWTGTLGMLPYPGGEEPQDCDWVSGAAMVVRLEAVEEAGPLDEEFFLYWEEVELCLRLRRRGWRTVLCPSAHGIHLDRGESSETWLPRFLLWRNRWLLYRRAYPWPQRWVAEAVTLLSALRDVLGLARAGRWRELWLPLLGNLYGWLGRYRRAGVARILSLAPPPADPPPAPPGSASPA